MMMVEAREEGETAGHIVLVLSNWRVSRRWVYLAIPLLGRPKKPISSRKGCSIKYLHPSQTAPQIGHQTPFKPQHQSVARVARAAGGSWGAVGGSQGKLS